MKLQDIFDQLSAGVLSQMSIGGQPAGVINEENYGKVMQHVGLGLTALYKRFNLKERRLTIPLQVDADTYMLDVDDLMKIEKVLTDTGFELNLNLDGDPFSVMTPTMNSIRVPQVILDQGSDLADELKTDGLTISYRANHPRVVLSPWMLLPQARSVELPGTHMAALLYFVASSVNNPIGMSNEFHAGNSWYGKYENECQRLELENFEVDKNTTNTRARRNGWV